MPWYAVTAIAILLALIVYLAVSYIIGAKCLQLVVRPTRLTDRQMRQTDEKNGFTACFTDYETHWEKHAFTLKSDDVTLAGEYVFNPSDRGPRRKVVILCHGLTASRPYALKYAKMFYDLGYSLVLYDARYFGASTGDCCTLGQNEEKDLRHIIDFTKTIFGEDAWIGLHGESMGAATVLLVLRGTNVAFVVADCPFANSDWLFREQLLMRFHFTFPPCLRFTHLLAKTKYGYDFDKVNPIDCVAQSQVPVCLIHGKADTFIQPHHSEDLFHVCKNRLSELHLVDGAGHACSCAVDAAGYEAVVGSFVGKVEAAGKEAAYLP